MYYKLNQRKSKRNDVTYIISNIKHLFIVGNKLYIEPIKYYLDWVYADNNINQPILQCKKSGQMYIITDFYNLHIME